MIGEVKHIINKLSKKYPSKEAEAISYILFEDLLGYNKIDIFTKTDYHLNAAESNILNEAADLALNDVPVQYITGKCIFLGLSIKVNPSVLIPRQETEFLTDIIVNENKSEGLQILDLCTGSGCIALGLKKHLINAQVTAVDISENALKTANENALLNKLSIDFMQTDITKIENNVWKHGFFDIMVSNPPYVCLSEKTLLAPNVVNYEPENALFVPDQTPLIYYSVILNNCLIFLKSKAKIYFEINENYGQEITNLISDYQLENIRIIQDINGKNRIATAIKK